LHKEFGKDLDIICIKPGGVNSNLNPLGIGAEPIVFAKSALTKVGYESETNGYWQHSLFATLLSSPIIGWVFGVMVSKMTLNAMRKLGEKRELNLMESNILKWYEWLV